MPGTLLPTSTLDPRWRNKLNLSLWVFTVEKEDPPATYTKLSKLVTIASRDLSEDDGDSECSVGPSEEIKVCSPSAGV